MDRQRRAGLLFVLPALLYFTAVFLVPLGESVLGSFYRTRPGGVSQFVGLRLYERVLDESMYATEAGVTGKVGQFQTINAGVEVNTDDVRLVIRAPQNRTQDIVAATWSITTSFAVPSDITAGGNERFKRAVVLEHALDG